MKILFLVPNQVNIGTFNRAYDLALHVSKSGPQILMLCTTKNDVDWKIRKKKINENFELITLPRYQLGRNLTGQELRFFISLWYIFRYRHNLTHAFSFAHPEIGVLALISKFFKRDKLILDWDDVYERGLALNHNFPIKNILSFFESHLPKHADRVTVISQFLLNKAKKIGVDPKKILKLPLGCNPEITELDKETCKKKLKLTNGNFLLSLGHGYFTTLPLLLQAFEIVLDELPNTNLILLSKLNLDEQSKKIIERLRGKILITGEVPRHQLNEYLCAADVCLLPMADSDFERGRNPYRITEYLSAGRPIVSNPPDGSEVKFTIETAKCGLTSKVNDVHDMAKCIVDLLKDKDKKNRMGKNAKNLAKNEWSYSKIAENLTKIYSDVLKE